MQLKQMILSCVMFLAFATLSYANPGDVTTEEQQAVEHASAQFYKSLNTMFTGDAAPMSEIWSHSDDVTYMGPAGGIEIGWEQVRAQWESQAALHLGGNVEPEAMHTIIGHDIAVVTCKEVGNNVDANGEPVLVSIRATNVFRKENGDWKLIGHHTDLLPFLEKVSVSIPTATETENPADSDPDTNAYPDSDSNAD
jgi:ketosteroid isomerase-like protein